VLAVRLAAPAILAEPAKLQTLQMRLDDAVSGGDMQRFSDLNQEFHGLFVTCASNALLAETLRRLNNSIYWLQFRMLVHRQE
ncbi:FCD domain-containing protein, partial [Mycobacterium tuberculosis]|nr:FCD domain-containing protein [Mycobacterium tuberculosis]